MRLNERIEGAPLAAGVAGTARMTAHDATPAAATAAEPSCDGTLTDTLPSSPRGGSYHDRGRARNERLADAAALGRLALRALAGAGGGATPARTGGARGRDVRRLGVGRRRAVP